ITPTFQLASAPISSQAFGLVRHARSIARDRDSLAVMLTGVSCRGEGERATRRPARGSPRPLARDRRGTLETQLLRSPPVSGDHSQLSSILRFESDLDLQWIPTPVAGAVPRP